MILILLIRKERTILIKISLLTTIHDDIDASILERINNSN